MLPPDMFAVSSYFTPSKYSVLSDFKTSAIVVGDILLQFCISLIINEIENLFMYPQVFGLPEKYLFIPFVHFSIMLFLVYVLLLQMQLYLLQISPPNLWLIFSFSVWFSDK